MEEKVIQEIGYKEGVFEINPNNIGNCKSFEEVERQLLDSMAWVKTSRTDEGKCSSLTMALFVGGFGKCITKDYFIKILEFVNLDWEVFEKYIIDCRKKTWLIVTTFWFDTLNFKNYLQSEEYVESKIEELKKERKK